MDIVKKLYLRNPLTAVFVPIILSVPFLLNYNLIFLFVAVLLLILSFAVGVHSLILMVKKPKYLLEARKDKKVNALTNKISYRMAVVTTYIFAPIVAVFYIVLGLVVLVGCLILLRALIHFLIY